MVWSEPLIVLATQFGLSDVGLKKLCKRRGVPTPPRGYWAKVNAGQQLDRPSLPETWTVERPPRKLAVSPDEVPRLASSRAYDERALSGVARRTLSTIRRVRSPATLVRTSGEGVFPAAVSRESALRAVFLWDTLRQALAALGVTADSTHRCFSDGVETVSIRIVELRSPFTRPFDQALDGRRSYYSGPPTHVKDYVCNGFLSLQVYDEVAAKTREWKDTRTRPLDVKIDLIARAIVELLGRMHLMRQEAQEQRRLFAERCQREALEAQRRCEQEERVRTLVGLATDLRQADEIRALVLRLEQFPVGDSELVEFLSWARQIAIDLDPCSDIIRRARNGDDPLGPRRHRI